MKILSWNVNGIRAVGKNGFFEWLDKESPDVICLQETKAHPDQLEDSYLAPFGYQSIFHSAKKPGYSGVATYFKVNTRQRPVDFREGIGVDSIDDEGRVLVSEFKDFFLINAYFPNSQREHTRLGYKLDFCKTIMQFCEKLLKTGKGVVLCGDYNIAHQEIDLRNPQSNKNNAGFLPQEREWMGQFLSRGWIDTFRHFCKEDGHYSWWSYRPGVRERNIGWRIDYHCVNTQFLPAVKRAWIMPEVLGSDHCPVAIELKS
jgi:exodeoxyribonuclease III